LDLHPIQEEEEVFMADQRRGAELMAVEQPEAKKSLKV